MIPIAPADHAAFFFPRGSARRGAVASATFTSGNARAPVAPAASARPISYLPRPSRLSRPCSTASIHRSRTSRAAATSFGSFFTARLRGCSRAAGPAAAGQASFDEHARAIAVWREEIPAAGAFPNRNPPAVILGVVASGRWSVVSEDAAGVVGCRWSVVSEMPGREPLVISPSSLIIGWSLRFGH